MDDTHIPTTGQGSARRARGQGADQSGQTAGTVDAWAKLMLTLAIVFLVLAILAGVLGLFVAGPVGPILLAVFLLLFLGAIVVHYVRESRARNPFK